MRSLAFLAVTGIGWAAPAAAQVMAVATPSQVVTTGYGEARIVPDRATIVVGVQSRAATASAASAENARRQSAILDTLRAVGLNNEQLSTINYSVSPEMQYNQNGGAPRVTGYTVSNSVRVALRRIEDVGRVIDAALAKGANDISSLQFESSKSDSVRRSAMAVAVANARGDAEALARAAGGSLGPLLELSTNSPPVQPMMRALATPAPGGMRTPIQPGEETINVIVSARWVFVPRGT